LLNKINLFGIILSIFYLIKVKHNKVRNKIYLFYVLIFISIASYSQSEVAVMGYVRDASNGEDLIGATIYVDQLKTGTISNPYGFYTLNLNPGFYTLTVSFLGYQSQKFTLSVDGKMTYNIKLEPSTEEIGEIVVSTEAINQNIIGTEMGAFKLNPKMIKAISVFNSDAINDVKLYKGGVPANFGGRASSVLDVHMREGNSERFAASGGIGMISSRLTLEGPLAKNGSSFLISGRRTYADLFLVFSNNESIKDSKLYFYDLNYLVIPRLYSTITIIKQRPI
jgi:hypothetical protein